MCRIDWQSMSERERFHLYHGDSEDHEMIKFMEDAECATPDRYEAMVPQRYADESEGY